MEFLGLFTSFNERFEGRTPFDWLSRDTAEVDKYVADPWSGSFAFSNGLAHDFFVGMNEIWKPGSEARIAKDLPVLVIAGDRDPAGGYSTATQVLIDRYRALRLRDLDIDVLPGRPSRDPE